MVATNLKRLLMGSQWVSGVTAVSIVVFIWLQCTDVSSDSFSHASKELQDSSSPGSALPVLPFNSIYFAHIGKAGGNTIRVIFEGFCHRKKTHLPEECSHMPESELGNRVTGYMHDWKFLGEPEDADAFLFNLRHPVDRMISWYNYEHPDSCMNNKQTERACQTAKDIEKYPGCKAEMFYRRCFPRQESLPLLALAVNHTDTQQLSHDCSKLARKVIRGKIFERGFKHMYYNMHHYTAETIDEYPDKEVLVVRTESLWQDAKDLDIMLGGNGTFGEIEGTRDSHGSEQYKRRNATFSAREYGLMCCALRDEMDIYRRLVELAGNLDNAAKQHTIASITRKCGFSSWDEMMSVCRN